METAHNFLVDQYKALILLAEVQQNHPAEVERQQSSQVEFVELHYTADWGTQEKLTARYLWQQETVPS